MSRLSPLRWLTLSQIWQERFYAALRSNAGQRDFDQGFIDRLQRRREIVEKNFWRLAIIQTVLLIALFLNAVVLQADISIAGLSARQVGAMKELILFISATIALFVSILAAERQFLKTIGTAWAREKYSPEVFEFAGILFGDVTMQLPDFTGAPGRFRFTTKFLS